MCVAVHNSQNHQPGGGTWALSVQAFRPCSNKGLQLLTIALALVSLADANKENPTSLTAAGIQRSGVFLASSLMVS
jgi:hypothetical protein